MPLFSALDASVSGVSMSKVWLDAISDNVANLNTIRPPDEEPFRARMVVVQSNDRKLGGTGGVHVSQIVSRPGDPAKAYDPTHPYADENGDVTLPHVELSVEMTNMILAQRSYQANLRMFETARDTYRSALQIGNR